MEECQKLFWMLELDFPWKNGICVYQYLATIICPDITQSFHIFPVYRIEKLIPGSVGVSHPVSRNFKSHFPNIPSKKVVNSTSWKSPARLGVSVIEYSIKSVTMIRICPLYIQEPVSSPTSSLFNADKSLFVCSETKRRGRWAECPGYPL